VGFVAPLCKLEKFKLRPKILAREGINILLIHAHKKHGLLLPPNKRGLAGKDSQFNDAESSAPGMAG
jgi:hypothetical protein